MSEICPELVRNNPGEADFENYRILHQQGRRLIRNWFFRGARHSEEPDNNSFEPFIFTWFALNGWAACVTEQDQDAKMIRSLMVTKELQSNFMNLLDTEPFREAAQAFHAMLPIFKVQNLRRNHLLYQQPYKPQDRRSVIQHYLMNNADEFAPACWQKHQAAGEAVPLDWPHTISAIYQVRCNLFHGEKSAHSEMDREIVFWAHKILVILFEPIIDNRSKRPARPNTRDERTD